MSDIECEENSPEMAELKLGVGESSQFTKNAGSQLEGFTTLQISGQESAVADRTLCRWKGGLESGE